MTQESWCLVALRRHRTLAVVIVSPTRIVDVTRALAAGPSCRQIVARTISQLAAEYGLEQIVVEPDSTPARALEDSSLRAKRRTLTDAARALLRAHDRPPRRLAQFALEQYPELERFACLQAIRQGDRRRTVVLLAAALGYAELLRSLSPNASSFLSSAAHAS